jgi:hypothetical protein
MVTCFNDFIWTKEDDQRVERIIEECKAKADRRFSTESNGRGRGKIPYSYHIITTEASTWKGTKWHVRNSLSERSFMFIIFLKQFRPTHHVQSIGQLCYDLGK